MTSAPYAIASAAAQIGAIAENRPTATAVIVDTSIRLAIARRRPSFTLHSLPSTLAPVHEPWS